VKNLEGFHLFTWNYSYVPHAKLCPDMLTLRDSFRGSTSNTNDQVPVVRANYLKKGKEGGNAQNNLPVRCYAYGNRTV